MKKCKEKNCYNYVFTHGLCRNHAYKHYSKQSWSQHIHTKVYDEYFDIDCHNRRRCEITGYQGKNVDIHHIRGRGEGMDVIENLMCIRRDLHERCGQNVKYNDWLQKVHDQYMIDRTTLYEKSSRDEIYLDLMGLKLHF